MLWFKACRRCNGEVYEDEDQYGPYLACLQCGYYLTDTETSRLRCSTAAQKAA